MDEPPRRVIDIPKTRGLRLLSSDERRRILSRLARHWPPADRAWWHPYDAVQADAGSLCLQSSWLGYALPIDAFRRRAERRWSKFWVIGEGTQTWDDPRPSFQGEFEISVGFLSPVLSSETVVTPRTLDWLAYTDHNELTWLVGRWLVETVKELWPEWDQHIGTSPFYDHPPDLGDDRPWWDAGRT